MVTDLQTMAASPLARRAGALIGAIAAVLDQSDVLTRTAEGVAGCLARGGTLYAAGNGGAASLAEHLVGEFLGRLSRDRERPPIAAYSLSSDTVVLTGIARAHGFDQVFARQLELAGRPGDVLVVFTTSGFSPNLVRAIEAARVAGMYRVVFTGPPGSPVDECEAVLNVPSGSSGTVQEAHLLLLHALVESVEDALVSVARSPRGRP